MAANIDTAGWTEIYGGFTAQDREFHCSTSGQPARSGEPIYRGSFVDLEGFYSICRDNAEQLASLIGWVEPSQVDAAVARQIELEDQVAQLQAEAESLHTLIDHLRSYDNLYVPSDPEGFEDHNEVADWVNQTGDTL